MKHISKIAVVAVALAGMTFPAAAQLNLSVVATPQTVGINGVTTYDIDINGLRSNPDLPLQSLGAFNITLDYDPSIAAIQSASFGTLLSNTGPDYQASDWTSTPGQLSLTEFSYDPSTTLEADQSSSFMLASFTIEGLSAGTTSLTFDLTGTSLSDENGNPLDLAAANSGSLTVTVPEPGTCALAGLGLAALALKVRRNRLN